MFDHLVGRPSASYKRFQSLFVVVALFYLSKKTSSFTRKIEEKLKKFSKFRVIVLSCLTVFSIQNLFTILGFNHVEPLRRMYTRSFFRATWILTAMDAGFFTAMHIRPKILRDFLSVVFTVIYLFCPDQANIKVKRFPTTAQTFRVSWEKSTNPILRLLTIFERGFLRIRKDIQIPRPQVPSVSSFEGTLPPIKARLYSKSTPLNSSQLIFHVPGGGFVAMSPIHHDDNLSQWARSTGSPIISIDYGKAPEYPYPYALEEIFDAYRSILDTNGRCIGIESEEPLKIVVMGDSAGGNLATGLVMKIIDFGCRLPSSLILVYPCLSFDIACWMSHNDLQMMEMDKRLDRVVQSKVELNKFDPLQIPDAPRSMNVERDSIDDSPSWFSRKENGESRIHSGLSMTSRMSYFGDRILNPEMLRSMALMYLADSPVKPDVNNDIYLSPLIAPEKILAQFPKTFILCGEKDPLIDDTVVFATRLKRAKVRVYEEYERKKTRSPHDDHLSFHAGPKSPIISKSPSESDHHLFARDPETMVKTKILPGMSHGFLQMITFLPEGRQASEFLGEWIKEGFLEKSDGANDVTFEILNEMVEIETNSVLLRRRDSLASRIGFSRI